MEPFVENYRQDFGVEPPRAELVRYIDPREYGKVRAKCMRGEGWPAEENDGGGMGFTERIPNEQAQAQQDSWFRCQYRYPVHPMYLEPYGERQVRVLYDHYADTVVPCLTTEGYVLEVPTWETFAARWDTPDKWTPYGTLVQKLSGQEWAQVRQACPEELPFDELFGDDLAGGQPAGP